MGGRAQRAAGLAVVAGLAVGACTRDPPQSRLVVPPGATAEPPATDPAMRWVTATVPLRREAGEPARGKPSDRAQTAGVLRTLQRGEQVRLIESRDGFARVRDADGTEGWLRAPALLPVDTTQAGTVLVEAWAFEQPDLLATNARKRVAPGTVLFVRNRRDLFTEVDTGGPQGAWILTDRLTTRPDDLAAARTLERARALQRTGRIDEARASLAALRASTPDSPLVAVLATELGEVPVDGQPGATGQTGQSGPIDVTGPSGPSGPPDDSTRSR